MAANVRGRKTEKNRRRWFVPAPLKTRKIRTPARNLGLKPGIDPTRLNALIDDLEASDFVGGKRWISAMSIHCALGILLSPPVTAEGDAAH